MSTLRDYQENSVSLIKQEFKRGKRKVLLFLATGAGKTVIFCHMVKETSRRGKKCMIVVRGRKLVDQASQRLFREDVPHGVMMAKHWNYKPTLPVQVCSIDTLISRDHCPEADLIIVDESHLATSKKYKEFIEKYKQSFIVAVTATPWPDASMSHIAETVVHPITMQELIDQNYLCPFRYFAPTMPDLSDVSISKSTHDYVNSELHTAMSSSVLTGQIIDHWIKIAQDRPTICFAVNIDHSLILVDRFRKAGIQAAHCDADTPDHERESLIRQLENGQIKVLSNVGILCTGVDIPSLGCIIMARPTKSRNLFIQQAGRGTRLCEGKTDCILLDHAGNITEHGFPVMEPPVDLEAKKKKKTESEKFNASICKECFCVFQGKECPECGSEKEVKNTEIVESEEELEEIVLKSKTPVEQWFEYLCHQQKSSGRKKNWVYYELIKRFTLEECKPLLPQWFYEKQLERLEDTWGPGVLEAAEILRNR